LPLVYLYIYFDTKYPLAAGGASPFVYEMHKSGLAGWRFGYFSTNNDLMRRSAKLYETPPLVSLRLYPRAARMGAINHLVNSTSKLLR
jgi:hypothetical protein